MRDILWNEHSNRPTKFFHINYIDLDSGFTYEAHRHKDYLELLYVCDGILKQVVNGRLRDYEGGSLILFRQDDWHEIRGGRGQVIVFRMNKQILADVEALLNLPGIFKRLENARNMVFLQVAEDCRDELEHMFRRLSTCTDQTMAGLLFLQLFCKLFADCFFNYLIQTSGDEVVAGWFNQLLIELQKRDVTTLKVADFSAICGYSTEHISRSFRKFLDKSPSEYINDLKLEHAAQLLTRTNHKLLHVCYESGFENAGYFHKLFKNKYNCTPNQYRKKNILS